MSKSTTITALAILVPTVFLTSCDKKKPTNTSQKTYPIEGLWEGVYLTDQVSHDTAYASFAIYPDGRLIRSNSEVGTSNYAISKGRWTLNGNEFEFTDTTIMFGGAGSVLKGKLTFINNGEMINGTWQAYGGQSYTGTFHNVKRIN